MEKALLPRAKVSRIALTPDTDGCMALARPQWQLFECRRRAGEKMPELTRSIVSRFRQFVGQRRRAKRHKVRLAFSISTASPAKSLSGASRTRTMGGHTHDLSASGLSLIVPAITLGEHHLVGENRNLNLKLELPAGPIELQVKPVRYESLEEHETESGYLIGAQIFGMSDEDRTKFVNYVSTLLDRKR